MALRYDVATLRKPTYRADGTARVDAYLTRVGVFEYLNADGSIRRELRLPEDVFHEDSLESFAGVPLTDDHPAKMVTGDNATALARGAVGDTVKRDGEFVRARITVLDAGLVSKMKSGKAELSCGYSCDLDVTPGTHPLYGRFDVRQINIRGNHVAVVNSGRAGSEVRARMDAGDAAMVARAPTTEERRMDEVTIKINGVDCKVAPQVAQLIEAERAASRADSARQLDEAKVARSRAEAERDSAKELAVKAEKERKDAADRFDAAVQARAELTALAAKHGVEAKGSDHEVRLAVVEKLRGEKLPEEKRSDAAYVSARLDAQLEQVGKDKLANGRKIVNDASNTGAKDHFDELEEARKRFEHRQKNRGQDPQSKEQE